MPTVQVRDNEPFDVALRRFKRAMEKAGILNEFKNRERFIPGWKDRQRKIAAAKKRAAKKEQREDPRKMRELEMMKKRKSKKAKQKRAVKKDESEK